ILYPFFQGIQSLLCQTYRLVSLISVRKEDILKEEAGPLHMIVHDAPCRTHEPGKGNIIPSCLDMPTRKTGHHVITAVPDKAPVKISLASRCIREPRGQRPELAD